jgi:3-deoxy-manno-octulosonate cytidylyltransferase (CMP-KDO synthetase)
VSLGPTAGEPVMAVIPARYGSTRFPGKPLAPLGGRPMIQHVWERCQRSGAFARVVVATDDERIALAVRGFGGEAVLTSPECPSGSDRVAEVARDAPGFDLFVNVQGDEPLLSPVALRELVAVLADPAVGVATLVRPLREEERANPNVVKALLASSGDALYFSRADLPYCRDPNARPKRYAHLGLYGFRRATLLRLAALPPSPLEQAEKLEQLRALEAGIAIRCALTDYVSVGVDTPLDLAQAEARLGAGE